MRTRINYWSCSRFATWVRGTHKPSAATAGEWDAWHKLVKSSYPLRYWIAEEGLDKIQNFLLWPSDKFDGVKHYLHNRFVSQSHALVAKKNHLKRGQWYDVDSRILPCLFDTLADYVESECAQMYVLCCSDDYRNRRKEYGYRWYHSLPFFDWKSPKAGIEYLKWEMTLIYDESYGVYSEDESYGKKTHQAIGAEEIYALYKWWTEVYPTRGDVHDISGWTEYCRKKEDGTDGSFWSVLNTDNETEDDKKEKHAILDECNRLEKQFQDEEEEMMIRLIKVRHRLWT